ncbi:hypothetical protein CL617_05060 [archaeon]|nr:hypothetical protein [archaeon]
MSQISEKTKLALKADISSILYENPLQAMFAKEISVELRRDKEFTKKLLLEMENEKLVERITKSSKGIDYKKRIRWKIPERVLQVYDENV